MPMRRLTVPAAVLLVVLSAASATSLGSFTDVVLSGTSAPQDPCIAGAVELQDSLGNALDLTLAATVEQVELSSLSGDCTSVIPTLLVTGLPPLSVDEQVLVVEELAPISTAAAVVTLTVDPGSALAGVVDGLNVITDVRTVFVPS